MKKMMTNSYAKFYSKPLSSFALVIMILCTHIFYPGVAQPLYHGNDYALPGDSFLVSNASIIDAQTFNFSQTGDSITWNYSNLTPVSQEWRTFVTPGQTGFQPFYILSCNFNCYASCYNNCVANGTMPAICAGSCTFTCGSSCVNKWFNLANLVEVRTDTFDLSIVTISNIYDFYKRSNSSLRQTAIGTRISGFPVIQEFDPPDVVYKFPLAYGNKDTSVSSFTISLDTIPANGININSFIYSHSQVRYTEVQGWGTLRTPFGVFENTLKVKSLIYNSDTIVVNGDTLAIPANLFTNIQVEYKWLVGGYGIPVLQATGQIVAGNEIITGVQFIDSLRCFEPFALFGMLPIPARIDSTGGTAIVSFYNIVLNTDSVHWDFDDTGSGTDNFSNIFNPNHSYSEPGIYNVTLTACNTSCVPVACASITLPVIVISSVSSTDDGSLHNEMKQYLNIFPNPSSGYFTIEWNLPGNEELSIDMFDMQGKLIQQVYKGTSSNSRRQILVDSRFLHSGLYLLRLQTSGGIIATGIMEAVR